MMGSPNIRKGLLEAFYGVYEKDPDKRLLCHLSYIGISSLPAKDQDSMPPEMLLFYTAKIWRPTHGPKSCLNIEVICSSWPAFRQVLHGAVSAMSPQVQGGSQQLPGSTPDQIKAATI
ncbi:uncharacterized protein LOC107633420 isoform X2 [Arachis ipaensis]|nr:uncharacterized protein LOC107633420 isoform X2 [Arachis ipaensis]XP_020979238.1 uncharacterized protein LOC107633420 isoform X2 [Arachis ipaensis]XP_025629289.1 uncharacterized protein LOC112722468 isoform X3 [Arachis hypogaea]QHO20541.1 uncharacterized protein DS421_11g338840 [Arachis hypogaea]